VRAHATAAQDAAIPVRDAPADLLTRHCATLRELRQPSAGIEDRLFRSAHRCVQRDRDLLVRKAAELAHQQGAPQPLRQLVQIGQQQREPLPVARLILCRRHRSPGGF
jgi:hypothetical protein